MNLHNSRFSNLSRRKPEPQKLEEMQVDFSLIFQVRQIEEIKRGNDEQSPTATE